MSKILLKLLISLTVFSVLSLPAHALEANTSKTILNYNLGSEVVLSAEQIRCY